VKPLSDFHRRGKNGHQAKCKACSKSYKHIPANHTRILEYQRNYCHENGLKRPLADAKDTSLYLGVYVAERVLSKFFDHIERMPYGNKGYDFICGKGFKIDAKSSCINKRNRHNDRWIFRLRRNKIPDYFLCLAFNDRESLDPMRIWLFPGEIVNHLANLSINNDPEALSKWSKFERPLDRVLSCCDQLNR